MYQKPLNLGRLLLRYWVIIVLAIIVFAYAAGWIPNAFRTIERKLQNNKSTQSETDSLYKAEQGQERREILKY